MFWFENPLFLLGIPFVFFAAYWLKKRFSENQEKKAFIIANFGVLQEALQKKENNHNWLRYLPFFQIASICFLFLALSEPHILLKQLSNSVQVILAIDTSKSMMATDFLPNRLMAAKKAALQFIEAKPPNLKVGLVFFHGSASLAVPLTKDRTAIKNALQKLSLNDLGNGTGLGEAIALAGKTFEKGGQRHLIVLTDGENNSGIDPFEALNDALGVKIYTVGIGDPLGATVKGGLVTKLDSDTLIELANSTGGEYFEVSSSQLQLNKVYKSFAQNYEWQTINTHLWPVFALLSLILAALSFVIAWFKLS